MTGRTRYLLWLILAAALLLSCWIFSVSRPGAGAEGCPEGCELADEGTGGPLTVKSLNMPRGFLRFERLPERFDLLGAEIK